MPSSKQQSVQQSAVEFTDLQNQDVFGFSILHGQDAQFVANVILPGIVKEKLKNNTIEEIFFVNTGFLQRYTIEMEMVEKSKKTAFAEALQDEEKWNRKLEEKIRQVTDLIIDEKPKSIKVSIENNNSISTKKNSNNNEESISSLHNKVNLVFRITIDDQSILIKMISWSALLLKEVMLDQVRKRIANKQIDEAKPITDSDLDEEFKLNKRLLSYLREKSIAIKNAIAKSGGNFNSFASNSFQKQKKEYDIEEGRLLATEYVFEETAVMLSWLCTHYAWKGNKVSEEIAAGISEIINYVVKYEQEILNNFPKYYKEKYNEELRVEELRKILKNISAFKIKNYVVNNGISKVQEKKSKKTENKNNENKNNNSKNIEGIERKGLGMELPGKVKQLTLSQSKEFSKSAENINPSKKEKELENPNKIPQRPKARSAPASLASSPNNEEFPDSLKNFAVSVKALQTTGLWKDTKSKNKFTDYEFLNQVAATAGITLGIMLSPANEDFKLKALDILSPFNKQRNPEREEVENSDSMAPS